MIEKVEIGMTVCCQHQGSLRKMKVVSFAPKASKTHGHSVWWCEVLETDPLYGSRYGKGLKSQTQMFSAE